MPEVCSPTLRRRELGGRLRGLRLQQGLTIDRVAERLLCSPSKVSRMETGERGAKSRDVRNLCRIYSVMAVAQAARLMDLAKEARQHARWQSHELHCFATHVCLKQAAASLCYCQPTIVPALSQTTGYLLQVWVVIDEAVLHRVVGAPAVMGAQLRNLVEVDRKPNVTFRVLPFAAGAHPVMDTTFTILEFSGVAPTVVYVEGLMGWLYIERGNEVTRYKQVLERLHTFALSPQESIELISEIRTQDNGALVSLPSRLKKMRTRPRGWGSTTT